ncbi:MFS transporter [Demequina pelophila]|uniref:MFS transporter n=1 Tax=Demequina pelophila TaxID=1638984 RepID=UPI00078295AF|nr:MFS transporter [Demequina pelophila]
MSDSTRTLDLDSLAHVLDHAPAHPPGTGTPTRDDAPEADPTTLAIPTVAGGEAVVVDQADPGVRSLASLTLSPRRAGLALAALAAGAFVTGANEASIVALGPAIAQGLGVSVAQVGLLATAFALTVVLAALPLTALTARLSRRLTLGVTMAVWTAGVAVAATATDFVQLAGGRVISAAAHALFWAVVAPTAASMFAPHLRGRTVTRVMLGASAAGVIGTPLVTVAGTHLGWQAPYWGFATLGALLAVALAGLLPGRPRARGATAEPDAQPDDADEAPAPRQDRGDLPSLRDYLRVLAVTFTASVAMSTTWTYVVPFFTDVAHVGTATVPVLFALGGTVAVGSTLVVGRFLATRPVETVAVGLVILAGAWGAMLLGHGYGAVGAQVLQASGWAILVAALLNWALRHTPWPADLGASTYMVVMNSGAALGPLLGGFIVGRWGLQATPLVSLGLTAGAIALTARLDPRTLRRLHVARRVRLALAQRGELEDRRREWIRRTRGAIDGTLAAGADAARATHRTTSRGVRGWLRGLAAAVRGHVADLDTHLR